MNFIPVFRTQKQMFEWMLYWSRKFDFGSWICHVSELDIGPWIWTVNQISKPSGARGNPANDSRGPGGRHLHQGRCGKTAAAETHGFRRVAGEQRQRTSAGRRFRKLEAPQKSWADDTLIASIWYYKSVQHSIIWSSSIFNAFAGIPSSSRLSPIGTWLQSLSNALARHANQKHL